MVYTGLFDTETVSVCPRCRCIKCICDVNKYGGVTPEPPYPTQNDFHQHHIEALESELCERDAEIARLRGAVERLQRYCGNKYVRQHSVPVDVRCNATDMPCPQDCPLVRDDKEGE